MKHKLVWILVLASAFASLSLVSGCGGPEAEAGASIANPEKGEGASADGAANQDAPSEAVDATQ